MPDKAILDWNTRMKIAAGAARGLEYLHDKASPPVIYRDLKCSNILLGEGYHPKLSDFGLAKLGPVGDNTHVSTRVMGTYGYCAPEYAMTGQLTLKSDVYSFGVVLLEIISGRKAVDNSKNGNEHNLVVWVSLSVSSAIFLFQLLELIPLDLCYFCRQDRCSRTRGNSHRLLILCSKVSTQREACTKLSPLQQCAFRSSLTCDP